MAGVRVLEPKAPKLAGAIALAAGMQHLLHQRWVSHSIASDLRVGSETVYRGCFDSLAKS